jgi:hypothetical protein
MFMCQILGHSNIEMTGRYVKLGRAHMAKTSGTAQEMWAEGKREHRIRCSRIVPGRVN